MVYTEGHVTCRCAQDHKKLHANDYSWRHQSRCLSNACTSQFQHQKVKSILTRKCEIIWFVQSTEVFPMIQRVLHFLPCSSAYFQPQNYYSCCWWPACRWNVQYALFEILIMMFLEWNQSNLFHWSCDLRHSEINCLNTFQKVDIFASIHRYKCELHNKLTINKYWLLKLYQNYFQRTKCLGHQV